ncbi:hypothetical protein D3C87_1682470 [compost metagenome]
MLPPGVEVERSIGITQVLVVHKSGLAEIAVGLAGHEFKQIVGVPAVGSRLAGQKPLQVNIRGIRISPGHFAAGRLRFGCQEACRVLLEKIRAGTQGQQ